MAEGGVLGILAAPLIKDMLLPFMLVFVLIFALLERTQVLGQDKHQINAIISFVMGLILVGVPNARGAITGIIPTVAVLAVVLLLFMIIYGFASGTKEGGILPNSIKIVFGIIAAVTIIASLLWSLGLISFVEGLSSQPWFSTAWQTIVFIVVIIVLIVIVIKSAGPPKPTGG
ncbi:hypothetical protein HZA33_05090 [Candidatus Pacearchaeota archaeon]|nr:hypothetical protein [Candidatus Pacearchaeota archaeon]